jgi:hypothetical protein
MLPIFQKKFVQELRDFSAASRERRSVVISERESFHLNNSRYQRRPSLVIKTCDYSTIAPPDDFGAEGHPGPGKAPWPSNRSNADTLGVCPRFLFFC